MPIYEYKCAKCGKEFETLVLRSDEAVDCPGCGSQKVNRQLSCFAMKDAGGAGGALGGGSCGSSGGFS